MPGDGYYYELLSHKTPLVSVKNITASVWVNSFFTAVPTTSGVGSGSSWHQDRDNRDEEWWIVAAPEQSCRSHCARCESPCRLDFKYALAKSLELRYCTAHVSKGPWDIAHVGDSD